MTSEVDRAAVGALLGREPLGSFEVVVRDDDGGPVVIRNAPLLDDGTPMPTRYWLVGPTEVRAVSRLESDGGVRRAEAEVDGAAIADAHTRYAAERDADLPPGDAESPSPSGGVGGTRQGVKCLHAHYAWHLAGGDDPVGRWVARRLAERLDVEIGAAVTVLRHAGTDRRLPVGPATLLADQLVDPDPATAAQLTNAIGFVMDHVDDVVRDQPEVMGAADVHISGEEAWHLATVEHGARPAGRASIDRDDVEDVFRALATENRADRLHNPGLDPARVDTVLGTCCVLVGVMRRLQLRRVTVHAPAGS
ncbi:MAG: DUF501 domain-containing protein [Ilumatobacteraceae bacterium]